MTSQKASKKPDALARAPKRLRGETRVASLLAAAAGIFAEKGFDGATMTEIAAQAGAPIGSLYQFFPTKELIANALLAKGSQALSDMLARLKETAGQQNAAGLADRLFTGSMAVLDANPAFIALSDGRAEAPHKQEMRAKMRGQIAELFSSVTPALPTGRTETVALVVLQMMKTAVILKREADTKLGDAALSELHQMLRHHLERIGAAP